MLAFLQLARPHQWLKNIILFFPPFLGGVLLLPGEWQKGVAPFVAFSLASSATYVFNDLRDRDNDRVHPRKKHRPLASGSVSIPAAICFALVMLIGSIAIGYTVSFVFCGWLLAYLGVSFAYSLGLKDQPVFDIFCIASGFVFRVFAGGAAFGVKVSDWLFLSVLLLAIFLSCGKRLSEKKLLGSASCDHRKVLETYPAGALEGFMYISGAAVLVTYTLYAITQHRLIYTVPLCCFGLFSYLLVVERGQSGDPTDMLMKDPMLFLTGLAWTLLVGWGIYGL
ncbi:decaprenyl-phosphate phosphoribosyltransferase [Geobacter grbiciae]|uniref:decaprenyl-phosphate phosphoribosyltransferase n=1 Tax=Geobacter grbiciae TaxID=155042 RepID=UPI001C02619C|nr:decaprenyl-phosphate phosphoribosyltransferase [Geobacter grbiciae]MBT1076700.1 decaprenyl-phosphate phosphoribosyltransferase [Geobacter grbiciae]